MKKNTNLKNFYDGVYVKGEKKHFNTFKKPIPTSELNETLKIISWNKKKVLDVGCGTGGFAYSVAARGGKILGIDYSSKAIEIAKSEYSHPNLEFMNLDVRKIVEKFDRIVSHGTLEHMDDPLSTLRFFKSHLNPKGQIIITTPNWTNLRGHILMTLWYLFNAPITLADLHYFTPRDFENFAKKLRMNLWWKTFDRDVSHGDYLLRDFEKRLPNVLHDAQLPNDKKRIKSFLYWIKNNVNTFDNELPHSGATGLYVFSFK